MNFLKHIVLSAIMSAISWSAISLEIQNIDMDSGTLDIYMENYAGCSYCSDPDYTTTTDGPGGGAGTLNLCEEFADAEWITDIGMNESQCTEVNGWYYDGGVAGFQLEFSGITMIGASGGMADDAGFSMSANATTILGFSLTGDLIEEGEGILINIEFSNFGGNDICLVPGTWDAPVTLFSDSIAELIILDLGDCYCEGTFDCNGVCNGGAVVDECNECGGNGIAAGECDCDGNEFDCAGVCGGNAEEDECGECNGDDSTCTDCSGVIAGDAYVDGCGDCVGGNTGFTACGIDCMGIFGGGARIDDCGVCRQCDEQDDLICEYNNWNVTCMDCAGEPETYMENLGDGFILDGNPNYGAVIDECGVCIGPEDEPGASCRDCSGECVQSQSGTGDICQGGENSGLTCSSDSDCPGVINGDAYLDVLGNCVDGNTQNYHSGADCDTLYIFMDPGHFGPSMVDNCGICDYNQDNDCLLDCLGEWGGTAYIDDCDICVGGTTDLEPCTYDCFGELGGSFIFDECGECGGNGPAQYHDCDGNCATDIDCSGECGGSALVDDCGTCGGNSSLCTDDCDDIHEDFLDSPYTYGNYEVAGGWNFECADLCGVPDGQNTDCNSDTWGTSSCPDIDECGICFGDGAVYGNIGCCAYEVDSCGICGGDIANQEDCLVDCMGVYGGDAEMDSCGICGGDNSACFDCAGVPNGTAQIDNCGACVTDDIDSCVQVEGTCDDEQYNIQATCEAAEEIWTPNCVSTACYPDCMGIWGGANYYDNCGICDFSLNNDCRLDCAGYWGGPDNVANASSGNGDESYFDQCGNCVTTRYYQGGYNNGAPACLLFDNLGNLQEDFIDNDMNDVLPDPFLFNTFDDYGHYFYFDKPEDFIYKCVDQPCIKDCSDEYDDEFQAGGFWDWNYGVNECTDDQYVTGNECLASGARWVNIGHDACGNCGGKCSFDDNEGMIICDSTWVSSLIFDGEYYTDSDDEPMEIADCSGVCSDDEAYGALLDLAGACYESTEDNSFIGGGCDLPDYTLILSNIDSLSTDTSLMYNLEYNSTEVISKLEFTIDGVEIDSIYGAPEYTIVVDSNLVIATKIDSSFLDTTCGTLFVLNLGNNTPTGISNIVVEDTTGTTLDFYYYTLLGCTDESACNYNPYAEDDDGSCENAEDGEDCNGNILAIKDYYLMPSEYNIYSIYPNPFNPTTNIEYGLPENAFIQISVYDLMGRKITTLVSSFQTAGYYSISWNANAQSSGVYFIKMESDVYKQTRQVILIK